MTTSTLGMSVEWPNLWLKKKAKTTTTTRHIFTKKTHEGKSRVEKQSEIAIQVEYPLEYVRATKVSKVTDCSPQLMISGSSGPESVPV